MEYYTVGMFTHVCIPYRILTVIILHKLSFFLPILNELLITVIQSFLKLCSFIWLLRSSKKCM